MSTTVTIRLDEETARNLEEAAMRTGRSKGEIVRDVIHSGLHSPGRKQ